MWPILMPLRTSLTCLIDFDCVQKGKGVLYTPFPFVKLCVVQCRTTHSLTKSMASPKTNVKFITIPVSGSNDTVFATLLVPAKNHLDTLPKSVVNNIRLSLSSSMEWALTQNSASDALGSRSLREVVLGPRFKYARRVNGSRNVIIPEAFTAGKK